MMQAAFFRSSLAGAAVDARTALCLRAGAIHSTTPTPATARRFASTPHPAGPAAFRAPLFLPSTTAAAASRRQGLLQLRRCSRGPQTDAEKPAQVVDAAVKTVNEAGDVPADGTVASPAAAKPAGEEAATGAEPAPLESKQLRRRLGKAIAILTGSQFLSNVSFAMLVPVMPQFAAEIGLGPSGIGAMLSAPAVARVLLNIPLGKAADVYGRKPLMLGGTIVGALGSILTAYSFSIATVIPARFIGGMGSAASMTGASAYMADLTAEVPHQRARIMGVQHTVVAAAFVAGPAIGGFLAELYGVRPAFLMVGCAMAASGVAFAFLEETVPAQSADDAGKHKVSAMELLKRSRETQGVAVMTGSLFLGYTALHTLLPLHAAGVLGASTGQIGMLFSCSAFAGLFGAPIGGYIADKYGKGRVVVPAAALCMTAACLLASASTYPAFVTAIVLWGLGSSVMHPGLMALAASAAPAHLRGESLAIPRQAGDLAFLFGPVTLGILAESFSCGFALMSTCVAYTFAAAFFVYKTRGSELAGL